MSEINVQTLENVIFSFVNTQFKETPPSEAEFLHVAKMMRMTMLQANVTVDDQEFEGILRRLKESLNVQMKPGVFIQDPKKKHQSWLPARRSEIDFFFWDRYKKYLEETKHWNPRLTANLGKVSEEILDLCGDPEEKRFAIKGMVLGDVQSGKTANYTGIINKAADAGYRIIIVLAGMQENLRRQTQDRLDHEFTGQSSAHFLDPKAEKTIKNTTVGVGKIDSKKKIVSMTSVKKDFDSNILKSNNLGIDNVNAPVILVIKKNSRILRNLITWLTSNTKLNETNQIDLPMLLIDDEADNASINTKNSEDDPTKINKLIRELLGSFTRSTYLGVTATPFANIFINPEIEEDLFPSDFIYCLSAPTNYIGPDRIFGSDGEYAGTLEVIDSHDLREKLPDNHKKDYILEELPSQLIEAVCYFMLVNAIRDLRGDTKDHRSMMVHISRFTNVQNQLTDILSEWMEQAKSDLRNYHALDSTEAERNKTIQRLHRVWDKFELVKKAGISWEILLKEYLYPAVAPIDVRAVNMKTGAASLNYDNYKDTGLRVIAVGGNSLSRGLTLEGLCVSFFYRNSKMYDTLFQMGRWFGYRPNYDDLIKIWMSESAVDWYTQITDAVNELKDEIVEMKNAHMTPSDFGLKVRQDPGALIVTARNKMRSATKFAVPVNISGRLIETARLKTDPEVLKKNEQLFREFINNLSKTGTRISETDERAKGNYFWEKVPNEMVSQLLRNFDTHIWNLKFNGKAIADFIDENRWEDGWDVVLINTGEGDPYPGSFEYGLDSIQLSHTEGRKITADNGMISISGSKVRVGAGGSTRIGLTNEQIQTAKENFQLTHPGRKNIPDSAYLIRNRRPILMLHVVEAKPVDSEQEDVPKYLFALGTGFPKSDSDTKTANYMLNAVELRNWLEPDEEDE